MAKKVHITYGKQRVALTVKQWGMVREVFEFVEAGDIEETVTDEDVFFETEELVRSLRVDRPKTEG